MRNYLDIPLTLILLLILTAGLLWPLNQPYSGPEWGDKLAHLVAFAALVFPLARTGRFSLLSVFFGAITFGGLIEFLQPNFNRNADLIDWIADTAGAILGILFGLIYRHYRMH